MRRSTAATTSCSRKSMMRPPGWWNTGSSSWWASRPSGTCSTKVRFRYSAWGEKTWVDGSSGDDLLASFTGKEYDATGLLYFNARYYDPIVGRFLTEDPSRKGHSWYSYCNNNPVTYTDPTGREYESATFAELTGHEPAPEQLRPRPWVHEAMAEWNRTHSYTSTTWVPGSTVTERFMRERYRLDV